MSKVDFAAIKAAIDLRDWARENLAQFTRGDPATALCPNPAHPEKTPSFKVWKDHAKCFGCGWKGDIFDLLELQGMARPQALEHAARLAGVAYVPTGPDTRRKATTPPPAESPTSGPGLDLEALVTAAEAAWPAGGLEGYEALEGVAKALRLGVVTAEVAQAIPGAAPYRGRLSIPTLDAQGQVVGITARALEGQEPKYQRPGGKKITPYNGDAALEAAKRDGVGWLLLTEGELDAAAALAALGIDSPVMGLSGGNIPADWVERLAGLEVFALMDNDNAGRNHTARLADKIRGRHKFYAIRWGAGDPEGADVRDMLNKLGCEGLKVWLEDRIAQAQIPVMDTEYMPTLWLTEMVERANRPAPKYVSTLASLDELLGGGYAEGLHILGGMPGEGKTLLTLQIAVENATQGRPVLFASYEQSRYELWARVAARLSKLPFGAFKRGRYSGPTGDVPTAARLAEDHEALERLQDLARYLCIVQGDGDNAWGVTRLKDEAAQLADAFGQPPLVIVDYLQRMPVASDIARRDIRERVATLASSLQVQVARGVGSPVLALSSVNRASYKGGQGELSAFKESGDVEYSAYTAALIHKPTKKEDDNHGPTSTMGGWQLAAITLNKNREGETGRILVKRYGKLGRLDDLGHSKIEAAEDD